MTDKDEPFVDEHLRRAGARWRASLPDPMTVDAATFAGVIRRERARWRGSALAGALGVAAVIVVAVAAIGVAGGPGPSRGGVGGPGSTGVATPLPTASAAVAGTSGPCRMTLPVPAFVPPQPYPPVPPPVYTSGWYGDTHLWTMLDVKGETWASLPSSEAGFGQKTFWWSTDWDSRIDFQPAITVTGRQLDGDGRFSTDGRGTNASFDLGTAMLVGVDVPTLGCWELTARYRDASLTIVVEAVAG
jgi:hypothetical protein